jgi:hypothetical protein
MARELKLEAALEKMTERAAGAGRAMADAQDREAQERGRANVAEAALKEAGNCDVRRTRRRTALPQAGLTQTQK